MKILKQIAKWIVILSVAQLAVITGFGAYLAYSSPAPWYATWPIPDSDVTLVMGLTHAHLFLAEYERTVAMQKPSGERVTLNLFMDTGGYKRSQLYKLADGKYVLEGAFDIALIDPKQFSVKEIHPMPVDAEYLGAFDIDPEFNQWRFFVPHEKCGARRATGGMDC